MAKNGEWTLRFSISVPLSVCPTFDFLSITEVPQNK